MGTFVPTTAAEREQMLRTIGVSSVEDLFRDVPQQMYLDGYLDLPPGRSELETLEAVSALAERNRVFKTCLRGAGSYRHYIPAAVKAVVTREEFVTAYTPYQAEISQGILQGIFEYQTMLCELTGMDVSNAGVYDGGTAAAEAIPMCRDRKRTKAYVSAAVDPNVLGVMKTYCFGSGTELIVVPMKDGRTDPDALRAADMLREEGVSAEVINIHTLKPVDRQAVLKSVKKTGRALTVENHSVFGGLHSAVCEILCEEFPVRCAAVAVNDRFGEVGRLNELKRFYGLTDRDIADKAKTLL